LRFEGAPHPGWGCLLGTEYSASPRLIADQGCRGTATSTASRVDSGPPATSGETYNGLSSALPVLWPWNRRLPAMWSTMAVYTCTCRYL
jgi:hypothetical protein